MSLTVIPPWKNPVIAATTLPLAAGAALRGTGYAPIPRGDAARTVARHGAARVLVSACQLSTQTAGAGTGSDVVMGQREMGVTAATTLGFGVNLNNREPLIAPGYGIP